MMMVPKRVVLVRIIGGVGGTTNVSSSSSSSSVSSSSLSTLLYVSLSKEEEDAMMMVVVRWWFWLFLTRLVLFNSNVKNCEELKKRKTYIVYTTIKRIGNERERERCVMMSSLFFPQYYYQHTYI